MVDIAATRTEAVEAVAKRARPGLVLADIQLADGSSGIDAVNDILARFDVPVIFITAFPERLLTGERPEPTFLITKPFQPETVKAAIGQALFFHPRPAGTAKPRDCLKAGLICEKLRARGIKSTAGPKCPARQGGQLSNSQTERPPREFVSSARW